MKNQYVIFALVVSAMFATGSGFTSTFDTPSKYQYAMDVNYACTDKTLTVQLSAIEGDGSPSGFNVLVLKEKFATLSGKTDETGKATFHIDEDGRYIVRVKKDTYFEKENIIEIRNCNTGQAFYCEDEVSMRARVACVLALPKEALKNIEYVPEECREHTPSARAVCIETRRRLESCQSIDLTDEKREACVKPKLNFTTSIIDSVNACKDELGFKKRLCLVEVRERVFTLTKFRMDGLVLKAHALWEDKRVGETDAIDFAVVVNEKKVAFDKAETITKKKEVLHELKAAWESFKKKVKEEVA